VSQISRAIISVTDKTGVLEFARGLAEHHVEVLSTGGTARMLREAGVAVKDVAEVTGLPEMLDGRVKTLHPTLHAGILARRDSAEHRRTLEQHGIGFIDMVVVNLYPFEEVAARSLRRLGRYPARRGARVDPVICGGLTWRQRRGPDERG